MEIEMSDTKKIKKPRAESSIQNSPDLLVKDIITLIDEAKNHVAREYNSTQALLCWLIGKRIDEEVLKSGRAEYGETMVASLSAHLTLSYGKGYSRPNLFRMIRFAKLFPNREIVSTLSRQLSWSHFILICGIDDDLKRDFYAEMCRVQRWSVRGLQKQLNGMLYERTALSRQPEGVIKSQLDTLKDNDLMTPELTFKEPYFLNFIGAHEYQSEEDLENSILNNITDFLQELGTDFCFVARQKRMGTGKKDRYLDLLFFNRRLRRLIAIDLKLGDFDPAYKGQMESHGQSELGFALSYLEQFDLLPRYKTIGNQKLYLPEDDFQVKNIREITTRAINWGLIEEQYHEMIKHAVALKTGTATADTIIRKFARSNYQHPTFKAFMELGKAVKTIFLCRYLHSVELRQQINAGLNVVENWNGANDFVYYGKSGEITSNSRDDQELSMLWLHLLQTGISYINTLLIEELLHDPYWLNRLGEDDYRALTALFYLHINPYVSFEVDLTKRLLIKPIMEGAMA